MLDAHSAPSSERKVTLRSKCQNLGSKFVGFMQCLYATHQQCWQGIWATDKFSILTLCTQTSRVLQTAVTHWKQRSIKQRLCRGSRSRWQVLQQRSRLAHLPLRMQLRNSYLWWDEGRIGACTSMMFKCTHAILTLSNPAIWRCQSRVSCWHHEIYGLHVSVNVHMTYRYLSLFLSLSHNACSSCNVTICYGGGTVQGCDRLREFGVV